MNNSKRLKKNKCFQCQNHNNLSFPLRYFQCCQVFLCTRCLLHHECSKSIIRENVCERCFSNEASLLCKTCKNKVFCLDCDDVMHKKVKLSHHIRQKMIQNLQRQEQKRRSKLSQLKEEVNVHQLQINLIEQQIKQKWEQLIKIISQRFETVFHELAQKKSQILQKLKTKKQQDLGKVYSFKEHQQQKNQKYSIKDLQAEIKQLRTFTLFSSDKKIFNKVQISNKVFQDIKKVTQKLNTKNIFTKLKEDEMLKRTMRSSCVLSNLSSGSNHLNTSGFKTPKNFNSKLSRSTMEHDFKELAEKPFAEEDIFTKVKENDSELMKVKSQRLFYNRLLKPAEMVNQKTGKSKK